MLLLRPFLRLARVFLPPQHDWIADLAHDLLVAIPPMVDHLNGERFRVLTGAEKAAAVVRETRRVLDAADDVPGWTDLPEHRRDKLIGGVSELALFIIEVTDKRWEPLFTEVDNKRIARSIPGRHLKIVRGLPTALSRLDHLARTSVD